jgi:hypothetical protein
MTVIPAFALQGERSRLEREKGSADERYGSQR